MRYKGITKVRDRKGMNKMQASFPYPEVPKMDGDLYIYATSQDRYDLLAQKYYEDQELWYIIALANVDAVGNAATLYPPKGKRIRIPASPLQFESNWNKETSKPLRIIKPKDKKPLNTGYTRIKLY